jgi:hypothetical protein
MVCIVSTPRKAVTPARLLRLAGDVKGKSTAWLTRPQMVWTGVWKRGGQRVELTIIPTEMA